MAGYSNQGANCPIVAVVGADLVIPITITLDGSARAWAGTTVVASIYTDRACTTAAAVTSFTWTNGASGAATMALTAAQITTLGIGTYYYRVLATISAVPVEWFNGTLSVKSPAIGGTATSAVTLAITTGGGITLTMTSAVTTGTAVVLADAGGYYATDTAEAALQQVGGASRRLLTGGGESIFDRVPNSASSAATSSQQLRCVGFQALRTESITRVRIFSGGTAAGPTPTLLRVGIYSFDGTTYSLAQSTASDTTLLATQNTTYTKTLQGTFSKVAGQEYIIAFLIVTGAALPTLITPGTNATTSVVTDLLLLAPAVLGTIAAQADLPGSFLASALTSTTTGGGFHCLLLP